MTVKPLIYGHQPHPDMLKTQAIIVNWIWQNSFEQF